MERVVGEEYRVGDARRKGDMQGIVKKKSNQVLWNRYKI